MLEQQTDRAGRRCCGGLVHGWRFWKNNPNPKVQEFVENIRERHAEEFPRTRTGSRSQRPGTTRPRFTMMIAEEKGTTPDTRLEEVRKKIEEGWASPENYEGVSDTTSIDSGGEAVKEVYVIKIEIGEFVRME